MDKELGDVRDPGVAYYWLTVRAALGLEIKTGLRHSRGSITAMLKKRGIIPRNARTKKQAWVALDTLLTGAGLPPGKRPWVTHSESQVPSGPRGGE